MKHYAQHFATMTCALVLAGCASTPPAPVKTPTPTASAAAARQADSIRRDYETALLREDLQRLESFSRVLRAMSDDMLALRKSIKAKKRGHYTSAEHDRIEKLLFRYLMCRDSLWNLVDRYRDYDKDFLPENHAKAFTICFSSAVHLAYYSSLIVATFVDDPKAVSKLNEAYYRCNIPAGTYDRLFSSVTAVKNIEALKTAWVFFSKELDIKRSGLEQLAGSDTPYKGLINTASRLYISAMDEISFILKRRSMFLPDVSNRLRQSAIAKLAGKLEKTFKNNMDAARAVLFVNVSRLKDPTAAPLKFSRPQFKTIKSMLEPGDVILTFSSGYMSNIFLPGKFKHGITYVGSPEQRKAVGLIEPAIKAAPDGRKDKIKSDLSRRVFKPGKEADVIEAVAEGVIFNSLDEIMDSHINRLAVLRPRVSREELIQALTTTFLLLGNTYDFEFDFGNATHHCCTEVIYRALHERGSVKFRLTNRMGVPTLSADDVILTYITTEPKPFDFVLFAEKNPATKKNTAVIHKGNTGATHFKRFMLDMIRGTE